MTVTADSRLNLKPHKLNFRYGNISENSHTKKYGNILKRMGVRWNDCENNERCSGNRLPPDGGILPLSSCHPVQINDRCDDQVITCSNYKNTDWFTQLSIPTHAQLQRHRLKFIKNHLKNSYMFRSTTIFREFTMSSLKSLLF